MKLKSRWILLLTLSLTSFALEVPNARLQRMRAEEAKEHAEPATVTPAKPVPATVKPPEEVRPIAPPSPAFLTPAKEEIAFKVGEQDAVKTTATENANIVFCRGKDKESEDVYVRLDLSDGKAVKQTVKGKAIEFRQVKAAKVSIWDQKDGYFHEFTTTPEVEFISGSASYVLRENGGVAIRAYVGDKFSYVGLRLTLVPHSAEIELNCDVLQSDPSMEQLLGKRFVRKVFEGQAAEPRQVKPLEFYKNHFATERVSLEQFRHWIEDALHHDCQVSGGSGGTIDGTNLINEKTKRPVGRVKDESSRPPTGGTPLTFYRTVHYSGNLSSGMGLEWKLTRDDFDETEMVRVLGRESKLGCRRDVRERGRPLEREWKCVCEGKTYAFPMDEVDLEFWKCVDKVLIQPIVRSVCK